MKRLYTYLTIFTLGLVTLGACTDELEVYNYNDVEEGNDVTLKLNLKAQSGKNILVSRALATEAEKKLYDLHFYVFDTSEQGKLIGYEMLKSDEGNIPTTIGDVRMRTKTGSAYIYAVANINKGSTYRLSDDDNDLLNVTDSITTVGMTKDAVMNAVNNRNELTRTKFRSIQYNRFHGGDGQNFSPKPSDDIFMMSGYMYNGSPVTIQMAGDEDGVGCIAEEDDTVRLYRILSKNRMIIKSNKRFTPKSYRFCNVPTEGILVPNAHINTANGMVSSDRYTPNNTPDVQVESSYQMNVPDSIIEFYFPENLPVSKQGATITLWKHREANSYATGSKVFTNAPDSAAYLEIHGDYTDSTGKITADVSYSIHLGNFSRNERIGDFNVIRNNNYIYTVSINGVNDIKAEAKVDNNIDNPYAEGLVINANGGKHYEVDAHYEARVMTFKKADIDTLKSRGSGYILNISTEFGKTLEPLTVKKEGNAIKVYKLDGDTLLATLNANGTLTKESGRRVFDREEDYRWIRFVKNTSGNRMSTSTNYSDLSKYPCKYPGDKWSKSVYSASNESGKPAQPWLNVFELLGELYITSEGNNVYNQNNNSEVYYTCFIDENYYYNKTWPSYVNKNPRTMLIANKLDISEDGKSLYAEVAYSILQRSISTFYTNEKVKAFGTEIIDEEDKYSKSPYNFDTRLGGTNNQYTYYREDNFKNQDDWNAYTSAHNTNNGGSWYSDYTNFYENTQPLYKDAAKACMSRNRDLDGDGTIEYNAVDSLNEIRWYLAAVDQYRALFFAQGGRGLDTDAVLISQDELREINDAHISGNNWRWKDGREHNDLNGHDFRGYYHYWTSSQTNAAGTFWPEEGLTNNPVNPRGWVSRAELVRCIRTLESGTTATNGKKYGVSNPQLYYTYDSIAPRTFDLNGITVNRGVIRGGFLPVHNETEIDYNDFYSSFTVAEDDIKNNNGSYRTFDIDNITNNSSDYCAQYYGEGWRTPNQKEFALMVSQIPALKKNHYGTRTKFSGRDTRVIDGKVKYYDWHQDSEGIWSKWNENNYNPNASINVGTGGGSVRIRCVRDNY